MRAVRTKLLDRADGFIGAFMLLASAAVFGPSLLRAQDDPRARLVADELEFLRGQIREFHARTGEYPDLAREGWEPLIRAGLLESRATNPLTGSWEIADRPARSAGWWYEGGELGACDAEGRAWDGATR